MTLKSSQRLRRNGFRIFRRFFLCANLRAVFKLEVRAPQREREWEEEKGERGMERGAFQQFRVTLRRDVAAAAAAAAVERV